MRRITFRIPQPYKYFLFSLVLVSWTTGVTFYYLSNWGAMEGDFGSQKHPAQFPLLMTHGAAAFLMILSFGGLLASHIPSAWKLKRSRYLGLTMVTLVAFQMLSAYLLYYVAWEEARPVIANLHAAVGFSLPFFLLTHVLIGKKNRKLDGNEKELQ